MQQKQEVDELRGEIDETVKTVSENMTWRREQLGMKLWEVSAATRGMDVGNISRYLRGQHEFTTAALYRFSKAFRVELGDWFLPHKAFRKKYAKDTDVAITVKVGKRNNGVKRTWLQSPSDLHEPIPA